LVEDARVAHAVASGERLTDVRFDRCVFEHVELTGCDVRGSHWCDVQLTDCELSGARVSESELVRVELAGGRAAGVVFVESTLRHVRFRDVRLDGVGFRGATLEHCVFERCALSEADFVDAILVDVELVDCDLRGADLAVQKCAHVFLSHCDVERVKGLARLRGATVTSDSILPLAMSAFAALGFEIDDLDDLT
jgi:uncharacterized protein YjbI with pentapeptide repeats